MNCQVIFDGSAPNVMRFKGWSRYHTTGDSAAVWNSWTNGNLRKRTKFGDALAGAGGHDV
jgi:hypothetical protein